MSLTKKMVKALTEEEATTEAAEAPASLEKRAEGIISKASAVLDEPLKAFKPAEEDGQLYVVIEGFKIRELNGQLETWSEDYNSWVPFNTIADFSVYHAARLQTNNKKPPVT